MGVVLRYFILSLFGLMLSLLISSQHLLAQSEQEVCTFTDQDGVIRQVRSRDNVPEHLRADASCFVPRINRKQNSRPRSESKASSQQALLCSYKDDTGRIQQVRGINSVPKRYRKMSQCVHPSEGRIAASNIAEPKDVDLDGNIREERMVSPLGIIELRWPRSVERLFGRTPKRAVVDAARAVYRAVKQSSISTQLGKWEEKWDIVFMDAEVPETQIPAYLVSNCHPGWMLPPAKIYMVGQRVAGGCDGRQSSSSVADSMLAEVLIHEMGHALDYALRPNNFGKNRAMIEGFATWFTSYASDYSSEISGGSVEKKQLQAARAAIIAHPGAWTFRGSGADYARASLFYHALVDRKGVKGLMRVYAEMNDTGVDFFTAADKAMYWDQERFGKEIERILK